jgi:hypothetical protein
VGVLTQQQQLEQCLSSWVQKATQRRGVNATQQSEIEAIQCLRSGTWQQAPALEQLTADGASSIDVTAVVAAGVKLAAEVDGPIHFVRPGRP